MSDHADNTAIVAAGYKRTQTDRGAGRSPRFLTAYAKPMVGEPTATGCEFRAEVGSDVSQADADAKAIVALNAGRKQRYGATAAGSGSRGGALTIDVS